MDKKVVSMISMLRIKLDVEMMKNWLLFQAGDMLTTTIDKLKNVKNSISACLGELEKSEDNKPRIVISR